MAADSAKSGSAADSYIGSVISLTSKSEIRYEGVLYHINPEESSIGLQNVRSFGSEGRKKDGPQIPPIDRIYEYILFRGSDIKDLQVKSSPTAGTTSSIDNDPAIIQSHYSHPAAAPSTLPTIASLSSADSSSHVQQLGGDQVSRFQGGDVNSLAPQMGLPGSSFQGEVNSHSPQLGLPGSNFPGRIPLYQPAGSLGAWGPSPPPNVNTNSLAVPMYWTGVYGPPSGLPPLHQQSVLRPPSGLAMPPTLQPTMQYPGFNVPLAPVSASVPGSNLSGDDAMSSTLQPMGQYPGFNVPLAPGSASVPGSNLSSSFVSGSSTITTDSSQPPSVPPVSLVTSITSETPSSLVLTKGSSSILPLMAVNTSLPLLSPPVVSNSEPSSIAQSTLNQVAPISESKLSYQNISQTTSSSITSTSNLNDVPKPLLVTPAQLLQPGKTQTSSSHAHRDVTVVRVSSVEEPTLSIPKEQTVQEKIIPAPKEAQPPILPLPAAPRAYRKPNGAPSQVQYGYRGRGRGRGNGRHPLTRFTEDFDFTAMNEKFNKDEVWGHLGKSGKSHSKDGEGEGNASDGDGSEYGNAAELPNVDVKPVYNKDDFFDSLSVPDGDSQHGRLRFSEQRKIDAETFGDFGRYRGRGGRGNGFINHGGRGGRGYNYRRGYGYGGTGRGGYGGGRGRGGNAVPSQAS